MKSEHPEDSFEPNVAAREEKKREGRDTRLMPYGLEKLERKKKKKDDFRKVSEENIDGEIIGASQFRKDVASGTWSVINFVTPV